MRVASQSQQIAARISALILTLPLLLSLLLCVPATAQESVEDLFAQGNTFYDSTEYIEAIGVYNRIIAEGQEAPELYLNLANAYFESGDLGHAILNYLRAQRLDPTDEDIRDNLAFARGFVSIQLEGVELNQVTEFFSSVSGRASLGFWGWLATCALALFCALLIYFIVAGDRSTLTKSGVATLFVVFIALSSITTFKYRHEFAAERAVVTLPEVAVTDRPSRDANVEFKAAAGLEVVIRERSGNFALALFANKRQGWLAIDALEPL